MAGSTRKTLTSSDDHTEKLMAEADAILRRNAAEESDRLFQSLGLSSRSDYKKEQEEIDARTKAAVARLEAADRAEAERAAQAQLPTERIDRSEPAMVIERRASNPPSQHAPLLEQNDSDLIANFNLTLKNFNLLLAYLDSIYADPDSVTFTADFCTFNGEMIDLLREEALQALVNDAKKNHGETVNVSHLRVENISFLSLLKTIHTSDSLNTDQFNSKRRVIASTKDFVRSVEREYRKTDAELKLAEQQSQRNNSRKANEKIIECKNKIRNLKDNLANTGVYVEKVIYNQATNKDYKMMNEYIKKQENPVLKNLLTGLFGITLITAGVFTIIGGATLALALGKTIALSPLSIHIAHTSFTLGLTTMKAGAGMIAGLTGAGVVYGGSKLFASSIRPTTPKDCMELIQEAREGMPLVQVDEEGNHLPPGTHRVINRGEDGRKGSQLQTVRKPSM